MHTTKKQQGFSATITVLCVVVLGGIALSSYSVLKNKDNSAKSVNSTAPIGTSQTNNSELNKVDDYKGWKTYTNNKYGLSLRYPQEWRAEERDPSLAKDSESTQLSLW